MELLNLPRLFVLLASFLALVAGFPASTSQLSRRQGACFSSPAEQDLTPVSGTEQYLVPVVADRGSAQWVDVINDDTGNVLVAIWKGGSEEAGQIHIALDYRAKAGQSSQRFEFTLWEDGLDSTWSKSFEGNSEYCILSEDQNLEEVQVSFKWI